MSAGIPVHTLTARMTAQTYKVLTVVWYDAFLFPQIAAYNSGYAPLHGNKTYGLGHWAIVREAQRQVAAQH